MLNLLLMDHLLHAAMVSTEISLWYDYGQMLGYSYGGSIVGFGILFAFIFSWLGRKQPKQAYSFPKWSRFLIVIILLGSFLHMQVLEIISNANYVWTATDFGHDIGALLGSLMGLFLFARYLLGHRRKSQLAADEISD